MNRPTWPFQIKVIVSLILLAFFVFLLSRFSSVLPPLILAIILAFVISPMTAAIEKRLHLPRLVAMLLAYLLIFIFLTLIPAVLIPMLATEFEGINLDVLLIIKNLQTFVSQPLFLAGLPIQTDQILNQISLATQGFFDAFLGQTVELLLAVISSVVWLIFIVIVSFYVVKDGDQIQQWVEDTVPPVFREDYVQLREQIGQIWVSFFRGQLILALVVCCLFIVIGLVLGLPFALGLGVLAGLLEFLPSIGHGIWLIIATGLALLAGSTWLPIPNWGFAILIICLHIIFQQFDLNYLIPRIIGRSVHLPPLVVILGIVTGAVSAGLLGIPLAAPTIASARVILRYIYRNLFDMEPFPNKDELPILQAKLRWWQRQS